MLFLLKSEEGRALVIAEAPSQEDADQFGWRNLPQYCGRIIEIDPHSKREAEEFWSVPSLRVCFQILQPNHEYQNGCDSKLPEELPFWPQNWAKLVIMKRYFDRN